MLIATHLSLGYGRTVLLEDVSLTLEPGTVTGLVAPNGFGKTTLLRALAGIDGARARGALDVDGTGPRDGSSLRCLVFYAPGDATLLYPNLTARDHLRMAARLSRARGKGRHRMRGNGGQGRGHGGEAKVSRRAGWRGLYVRESCAAKAFAGRGRVGCLRGKREDIWGDPSRRIRAAWFMEGEQRQLAARGGGVCEEGFRTAWAFAGRGRGGA